MSRCRVLVLAGWIVCLLPALRGAPAPDEGEREPNRPILLDSLGDRLPPGALVRMGSQRFRHGSAVLNMLYSPDGRVLVTMGTDRKVRVWEANSGRQLREIPIPFMDNGNALVFTPDGKTLAHASGNPRIFLWDLATGKEVRKFEELNFGVTALSFSADGKTLATVGNNQMVQLWDVATAKEKAQLMWRKEQAPAEGNDFAKIIRAIQDIVNGVPPMGNNEFFNYQSVVFSSDGKMLASAGFDQNGQGRIRIWDPVQNKQLREWTGAQGGIGKIDFSPDGKVLGVIAQNQTAIHLLDAATGKELSAIGGGNAGNTIVSHFAFAPDSKTIVYAAMNEPIRRVDVATGKEVGKLEGTLGIQAMAFSPDGKTFAAANLGVQLWDTQTWKEQKSHGGHAGPIAMLAFTADGKKLMTTAGDNTFRVWDTANGRETRQVQTVAEADDGFSAGALAFAPESRRLAMSFFKYDQMNNQIQEGQVRLWDLESGKVLRKFSVPDVGAGTVAIGPGGKLLAASWYDGIIRIWDTTTGKEMRQLRFAGQENPEGGNGNVDLSGGSMTLVFSPDGKFLITRESVVPQQAENGVIDAETYEVTSRIRFWEISTGKVRRQFEFKGLATEARVPRPMFFNRVGAVPIGDFDDEGSDLGALVFSPDGKAMALSGYENIHLYSVTTGKEQRRFGGHRVNSGTAVFSPDGRLLAAGTHDGSVRIWETATGTVLAEFAGHRNGVTGIAFSSDGKLLASGGNDTTALVWDVLRLLEDARERKSNLDAQKLEKLWAELGDEDAARADRAVLELAAAPARAIPYLRQHLKPRPAEVDAKTIDKLIAELDSNEFAAREKATQELEKVGRLAERALKKALASPQPSLELRRRMERLLEKLEGPVTAPELLRALRALEVLEQVGSPEARLILESLAKGADGDELTQEARAALARLPRQP